MTVWLNRLKLCSSRCFGFSSLPPLSSSSLLFCCCEWVSMLCCVIPLSVCTRERKQRERVRNIRKSPIAESGVLQNSYWYDNWVTKMTPVWSLGVQNEKGVCLTILLWCYLWQPSSVLESTLILRAAVSLRNMVKIAKFRKKWLYVTYLFGQNPQDVELE